MTVYHVFEAFCVCIGKLVHLEPSSNLDVTLASVFKRPVVHSLLRNRPRWRLFSSLTIFTEPDDCRWLWVRSFVTYMTTHILQGTWLGNSIVFRGSLFCFHRAFNVCYFYIDVDWCLTNPKIHGLVAYGACADRRRGPFFRNFV